MNLGGTFIEKPVDDEIIKMCTELQGELEKKTGKTYSSYKPLKYGSQVVAGMNFFVKICVKVGEGKPEHIHIRIFKPLPCNGDKCEVHSFQEEKSETDAIIYF
eukprot:TRINITY_DN3707_c0_g3_i1.p1 TRINITY_DN3707_c0_g3~~TRINITY_DN3707_c0_g3_i1.p1  ORF type:complete len:103 (-),score=22.58 TRINITY_DN3707_c0_g3_i1:60-368(-)